MSSIAAAVRPDDATNANIFTDKTQLFCVNGFKGDDELLDSPQSSQSMSAWASYCISGLAGPPDCGEPNEKPMPCPCQLMQCQCKNADEKEEKTNARYACPVRPSPFPAYLVLSINNPWYDDQ